ncbi:MAG TPA: pyrimidine reductase family protein [Acidimicrobiales bacterium]|nr:pyrimidine reductase family protein [Acidimicrobiales bacterium]
MRQLFPEATIDVELVDAYGRLAPSGDRPAVRANMIASVDGAASAEGRSGGLSGRADKTLFSALRCLADVVLVGSGTVRAERYGPARLDDAARARRTGWGIAPVPPIAVVTASCHLDWQTPFFTAAEQRPIVVTVGAADPSDRAAAAEVAEVIVAGQHQVDFGRALAALRDRGHANVLAEGGPSLLAQLVSAGVVDELCLTLSPLLLAGDAGRILAGPALVPAPSLDLVHVLESDGFLFMRYRSHHAGHAPPVGSS